MRAVKADLDQARQEIEVPAAAPENDAQEMEEETVEGITDAILERLSANATVRNKVGCVLRVVQTQAILHLKSMSERGGSDIERL